MSALENVHYGFEHYLKWLSLQIVHFEGMGAIKKASLLQEASAMLIDVPRENAQNMRSV